MTSIQPGEMVDHFRVMRSIGQGGQGSVYVARDTKLGRKVALKLISPKKQISRKRIDRFLFEARATARFAHPNIVTIYSAGEHGGLPYVALEYLEGETLRERMKQPLGEKEALRIALQIAAAVAEAHRHGVLHRDLKPENVIIPLDGRVRVLDFGLATLVDRSIDDEDLGAASDGPTTSGGTPLYMAPEQWLRNPPSEATDVWALAVISYEFLTGRRPYQADTIQTLAEKVTGTEPPPPLTAAPQGVVDTLSRALDRSPSLRPTARALASAIEAALAGRSDHELVEESPFPGLVPFAERQAPLFFGRTREIQTFVERARSLPVLPIVGPSGAGKSSLVMAGVIPMLREQAQWLVLRLRPGARPFDALAHRLLRSGSAGEVALLAVRLSELPETLSLELLALADRERSNVLLFVDQLEEICTLVDDDQVRRRFLTAILSAADDPQDPVRVVFTLRDDFLGKLPGGALVEQVLGRSTVLRPPGGDALAEVILGPLRASGHSIDDPSLVPEMIAAVKGSAAALPLLQFTCRALWERRNLATKQIERRAYAEIGGVAGALAAHADGVLDGLSDDQLRTARALLLRFITSEGTRRQLDEADTIDGLGPGAAGVRERFVEARLLVVHRGGERRYELAHESLVTEWKRLARWVDEAREELVALEEIERAAELWDRRGRRAEETWTDRQLTPGQRKLASVRAQAFIAAGARAATRRVRRRRLLSGGAFVLLAALATVFYLAKERAEVERSRAEVERSRAEREASELAYARGDPWAARARLRSALEIADDLRARALWMRIESDPIRFTRPDQEAMHVIAAGDRFLLLAWRQPPLALSATDFEPIGTIGEAGENYIFAIDPAHRRLATGSADGTVALWAIDSNTELAAVKVRSGPISALAFSKDGSELASGGWDGWLSVFRLPSLEVRAELEAHRDRVYGLDFGDALISSGWDGATRAWDLRTGEHRTVAESASKVLSFAADRGTVALGREDGVVEIHRGETHLEIGAHALSVTAVAFHPLHPWLATASWDGSVRLFDAASGRALGAPVRLGDGATDLAFLPRGAALPRSAGLPGSAGLPPSGMAMVTLRRSGIAAIDLSRPPEADDPGPPPLADVIDVAADGTIAATAPGHRVVLRAPEDGRVIRLLEGHTDTVRAVAFRPGHDEIASAGFDETIRVFDVRTGKTRHIISGHRGPVSMVAYSPDGSRLASAGFDATLRIFDADTGAPLFLKEAPARLITVRFSGDGSSIVTGTFGGHVELRRTTDYERIAELRCRNGRIAHEVVFDGADRLLAICGPSLETFALDGRAAPPPQELPREFACLAISPDRTRVLHSAGEEVVLRADAVVARIPRGSHACAFSPDGSFFVTVETDGAVRRYDGRSGAPAWDRTPSVAGEVRLELEPGSTAVGREDGSAAIVDAEAQPLWSVRLFGPIARFTRSSTGTLTIESTLGQRRDLDLTPLVADYCALMATVWERAPSSWRAGRAVPSPPPDDHRCR